MTQDDSLGNEALDLILLTDGKLSVLDVGCGMGHQSKKFKDVGWEVTSTDYTARTKGVIAGDYTQLKFKQHDIVWCSHVLEHVLDTHTFIKKLITDCKDEGIIAITVPPLKHEIVGGHVSLWNAGLLLYRMVLAGLDCRDAKVKQYGYNISVIVRKKLIKEMPEIMSANGDIEKLAQYFPIPVRQGFAGNSINCNWVAYGNTRREPVQVEQPKPETKKEPEQEFSLRDVPTDFGDMLPKQLMWISKDKGAWGNWPKNGPIAELYKYYNKWLEVASNRKVCVQAGGNCGMYARFYTSFFEHVHSFEPEVKNFYCLETNLKNVNATAYNVGLSDSERIGKLSVKSGTNVGMHSINEKEGREIKLITLDSLELQDVGLIHLDVEGHEESVIRGAVETIKRCRPGIVSERSIGSVFTTLGLNYIEDKKQHDHVYRPGEDK